MSRRAKGSSMTYGDGIGIALASLVENPLRTFLTLLGITIGVTAVIFVVSVIQGLNGYIASTIGDLGPDTFVLDRFGIITNREEFIKAAQRNKDLKIEDADAIRRQAREVAKVAISFDTHRTVRRGSQEITDVEVRGVSSDFLDIAPIKVAAGRTFLPYDASDVTFIGSDVAEHLFPNGDPIGREIQFLRRHFKVIGVAEKKGSFIGQSQDNWVMIPLPVFSRVHGAHRSGNIMIKARSLARVPYALDEVRAIMRVRHKTPQQEDDDFGIVTSDAIMGFWKKLTANIFSVAIFVVSISLVVGGIVIMNIMLLSVVERTREIGVRKAIGASQHDIEFQFLVESIVLCAAGGLIGVILAWAAAFAVRSFTPLPAQFPLWAPLLAVGLTSAVGIIFGLHPARKAGRLDPIEALRSNEL